MPDERDERRDQVDNRPNGQRPDLPATPVADDELLFRHIPGGLQFQYPPDNPITSQNFRLRPGERGLSVSRSALTTPAAVLARLGDPAKGSRIAACRAADLRDLGFEVVPDRLDDDPAHALILPGSNDLSARTPRKRLANLFQFLDVPERPADELEDQP
jgi:hypothetical protein